MRLSDEVEAADWVSIRDRILWRMANALFAEFKRDADDLAVVVRAHLHIEHELDELIYFAAPNPTHLKERMEYSEKVWLALVLGMNAELKPALNAVGNLRTNFLTDWIRSWERKRRRIWLRRLRVQLSSGSRHS